MNPRSLSGILLALSTLASGLELSGATKLPFSGIYSDDIDINVSGDYQVKWKFWTLYGEPVREAVAAVRFTPGSGWIKADFQKWVRLPDHVLSRIIFKDASVGLSSSLNGPILMMDVGVHAAPCVSQTASSSCWGFNTPGSPAWEKLAYVGTQELWAFGLRAGGSIRINASDSTFPPYQPWSTRKDVMDFVKDPNLQRDIKIRGVKLKIDLSAARAFLAGIRAAEQDSLQRRISSELRKTDSIEAARLRKAAKSDANFWNQPTTAGTSAVTADFRTSRRNEWKKAKEASERFRQDSSEAIKGWQASMESQSLRLVELKAAAARGLQVNKRHRLDCVGLERFLNQGGIPPKGTYPSNAFVLVDSATGRMAGGEAYHGCRSGTNYAEVQRFPSVSNSDRSASDNLAVVDHTGRVVVSTAPNESVRLFEDLYAVVVGKEDVSIWNLQEGRRLAGPLRKTGAFSQMHSFGEASIVNQGEGIRAFKILLDGSVSKLDDKGCGHFQVVRRYRLFDLATGKDIGGKEEASVESNFCLHAR